MNLFASASKKHPIKEPLRPDAPNELQQKCHVYKKRRRMGRWLHKAEDGQYRKPEEEAK